MRDYAIDIRIASTLYSRLTLPVILDTIDLHKTDEQVVIQGLSLLQCIFRDANCRGFLLSHHTIELLVSLLQHNPQSIAVTHISLLLLKLFTSSLMN